jgi:hypothetical protein
MSGLFDDPADVTGIDFVALHGCLLIVAPTGYEDHIPTVHTEPGEKTPAVRATVTVLDGAQAGSVIEDTLIFPRVLIGQLRSKVGRLVLGRLVQGEAQKGKNAPWRLDPASAADTAQAEAYLNRSRLTGPAPVQQAPQNGWGQGPVAQQPPPGYAQQPPAQQPMWQGPQGQPQQVPQSAPPF